MQDMEASDELEDCAICMTEMQPYSVSEEELGVLKCDNCLMMWKDVETTCPKDRIVFEYIGPSLRQIPVERKVTAEENEEEDDEEEEELLYDEGCFMCSGYDEQESIIRCDGCGRRFHLMCMQFEAIPLDDWHCFMCMEARNAAQRPQPNNQARPAARQRNPRPRGQARAPAAPSSASIPRPPARPTRSSLMMQIRREMAQIRRERSMQMRVVNAASSSKSKTRKRQTASAQVPQAPAGCCSRLEPIAPKLTAFLDLGNSKRKREEEEAASRKRSAPEDPFSDVWKEFERAKKMQSSTPLTSSSSNSIRPFRTDTKIQQEVSPRSSSLDRLRPLGNAEVEHTLLAPLIDIKGKARATTEELSTSDSRDGALSEGSDVVKKDVKGKKPANALDKPAIRADTPSKADIYAYVKKEISTFWHSGRMKDKDEYKQIAKSLTESVLKEVMEKSIGKDDAATITLIAKDHVSKEDIAKRK
ncbi:PHD and RING finger domain-containing protein 1 [Phlyctochytrium bullatum]|nr:PHD and RING finger domain-containing protein 1 [Phlyctochytrium bullatum]